MPYILHEVLESLGRIRGNPFQKHFIPQRTEIVQRQEQLLIGNTRPNFTGYNIYIPFKEKSYPRILIIAPTGAGKTTLICSLCYQAYQNGILPLILFDVRNEYADQLKKAFHFFNAQYLLEEAVVKLVPEFIRRNVTESYANYVPYQFDFDYMSNEDIQTILGFTQIEHEAIRVGIENLLFTIPKNQRNIHNILAIVGNKNEFLLRTEGNIQNKTRQTMLGRLKRAYHQSLLGSKRININNYLSTFKILDFGFKNYDTIDKNYSYAYLSVLVRYIRNLMARASFRVMTVIDEAHEVLPAEREPSCKKEIDISIRRSRTNNEAIVLSTQEIGGLDKKIIKNCQEFIISPKTPASDVDYLLKEMNIGWEKAYHIKDDLLPSMKRKSVDLGFRPWLRINDLGEFMPFFPYIKV